MGMDFFFPLMLVHFRRPQRGFQFDGIPSPGLGHCPFPALPLPPSFKRIPPLQTGTHFLASPLGPDVSVGCLVFSRSAHFPFSANGILFLSAPPLPRQFDFSLLPYSQDLPNSS